MLAACRRIPAAHSAVLKGEWRRRDWPSRAMLSRMTLGVVGFGRLGRKVARAARALEMRVNYYDPYVPGGIPSLLELARVSNVLTLHAIANDDTRGLVGRDVLQALPADAVVVNTARGELLDTIDGEYRMDFEEVLRASRLVEYARTHDNLVLTPHIGGSTLDAWTETQRRVIVKAASALGITVAT